MFPIFFGTTFNTIVVLALIHSINSSHWLIIFKYHRRFHFSFDAIESRCRHFNIIPFCSRRKRVNIPFVNISTDNDTIITGHFEMITMTNADSINTRKSSGRSPDSSDKICSCRKKIPRKLQRCVVIICINNAMFILIIT